MLGLGVEKISVVQERGLFVFIMGWPPVGQIIGGFDF